MIIIIKKTLILFGDGISQQQQQHRRRLWRGAGYFKIIQRRPMKERSNTYSQYIKYLVAFNFGLFLRI